MLGLHRALQSAGARSALTSLWKLPDQATCALMGRFYENYWERNMGTLESLREAQLWMLREGAERGLEFEDEEDAADHSGRVSPEYWGAFVLSGDWR